MFFEYVERLSKMDSSPDWNRVWHNTVLENQPEIGKNLFTYILDNALNFVKDKNGNALEIGCFPGRFIDYVGSYGMEISGIDTYDRVHELGPWLKSRGRRVGQFLNLDMKTINDAFPSKFDFVFSLGLIEHFEDFCQVLEYHSNCVKNNGILLVGAPNFASIVQRSLHKSFDYKNIQGHVLSAMYPELWNVYLTSLGFDVLYCGHFGGFGFWSETPSHDRDVLHMQNLIPQLAPTFNELNSQLKSAESAYNIIIARKFIATNPDADILKNMRTICLRLATSLSEKDEKMSNILSNTIKTLINFNFEKN